MNSCLGLHTEKEMTDMRRDMLACVCVRGEMGDGGRE